jgi:hypothetical protein
MLTKPEEHCLCSNKALRDTLAEKYVTKILKCFTISAAPCTFTLKTEAVLFSDNIIVTYHTTHPSPENNLNISQILHKYKEILGNLILGYYISVSH